MTPIWREYSDFSGLPARQTRGANGYRRLGRPERWLAAVIWHFPWHLGALPLSGALDCMTSERLMLALAAHAAGR